MDQTPLWSPNNVNETLLADFIHFVQRDINDGYDALWRWSCDDLNGFWSALWDFTGVIGTKGDIALPAYNTMQNATFFPEAALNYAENLLKYRDEDNAIIFWGENQVKTRINHRELYDAVSQFRQFLSEQGVTKGDRVAGFVSNTPEAVIAMLATLSIGAIWTSASPDFGVQGILDRFGQIEPKIVIATAGYYYNGKIIDCQDKITTFLASLPTVEACVTIPYAVNKADITDNLSKNIWDDVLGRYDFQNIEFERVAFNHPAFILYSSGTTGAPKCIVHGHGGTLLTHLKEHQLHCDIKKGDRVFYFTTCGWMMWNWQVSALASGAAILLYDGSPLAPDGKILWDYAADEHATLFGTAAKYIDALNKSGIKPKDSHDLSSLKILTSTGSPLLHESYDFIYTHIKADLHVASISGGTDIVSCFVMGNPISPVYRGEIQCAGLGYTMDAYDDNGTPVGIGMKGEMVCTKPFPSMPVSFWKDHDGEKYHNAYFSEFDNTWCHGDYIEKTPHGGWIIHGRSDATLNPGGVRIGTAEIYRQVEQIPQIKDSVVIGQQWDGDVRVILFVMMQDGVILDDDFITTIKQKIRTGASPRHVPEKIVAVADIPKTKSGKITEIAVRDIVHGKEVKNTEALANPESLNYFRDLSALSS